MITNELDDPRLSMVDVLAVDVSKDLRSAKIYVIHRDSEVDRKETMKGLLNAVPYLRRELATRCSLRVVPELTFTYDDTPLKAARIDELFIRISQQERPAPSTSE
jgi:ribosome-binding factor A